MTVLDKIVVPDAEAIKSEAVTVVIASLGLSKAAFFCRQHLAQPTDYLEFKEKAFANESVADLTARIVAERNGSPAS